MTSGEIKAFLTLIIAIGLVNQEDIPVYCSTDKVLSTKREIYEHFFTCATMTAMFLEDRQGSTQSASLVLYTVLSMKSSQVFGSQEKMFASMRV